MAAYCTTADVKAVSSDWTGETTPFDTRATAAITRASAMIDQQTNQWFDSRHLSIITAPGVPDCRRLFMPARIISLDSVTENGVAVAGVIKASTWLEKPGNGGCPPTWRQGQQNVTVQGHFGFAVTPDDIVQATAHLAAILIGLVQRQYTAPDGGQSASLALKIPAFIQLMITQNTLVGLNYQDYQISTVV